MERFKKSSGFILGMVHTISTFCYIGEHRIDNRSRLKLPPEVLNMLKASNDRNLKRDEFKLERTGASLDISYGDRIVLVVPNGALHPDSFSIDDLVYLSTGVLEGPTPVLNANDPNLVFLYSMTDAVRTIYQDRPWAGTEAQVSSLPEKVSNHERFRLAHIDKQHRILLKPFEVTIAEGPERYTRIEGYQTLSCFTLRKSDYAGRGAVIQPSSNPPAQSYPRSQGF